MDNSVVISSIAPKKARQRSSLPKPRLSGDGIGLADFTVQDYGRGQENGNTRRQEQTDWLSVGTTQKYAASWELLKNKRWDRQLYCKFL